MESDNAEKTFLMLLIPVVLFFVCLIGSQVLMPENCYLYDNRNFGQMCHTIPEIEPCPICKDVMAATLARVLFVASFVFLLIPFAVGMIHSRRGSIEQPKLFEVNE